MFPRTRRGVPDPEEKDAEIHKKDGEIQKKMKKTLLEIPTYQRWDEKAGLPRDAIRSQCSTCSKHNEKETGNARD